MQDSKLISGYVSKVEWKGFVEGTILFPRLYKENTLHYWFGDHPERFTHRVIISAHITNPNMGA